MSEPQVFKKGDLVFMTCKHLKWECLQLILGEKGHGYYGATYLYYTLYGKHGDRDISSKFNESEFNFPLIDKIEIIGTL